MEIDDDTKSMDSVVPPEDKKKSVILPVASGIIGIGLGVVIGLMLFSEPPEGEFVEEDPLERTAYADLRVDLSYLLKEHVNLGIETLRNAYDQRETFNASFEALDQNSIDLASVMGGVYGSGAEESFLELWREHIGLLADYTSALMESDAEGLEAAMEGIQNSSEEMGEFFAEHNPNINQEVVASHMIEQSEFITDSMDAYAAGNYSASYEIEREANIHTSKLSELLASAIVKQFPENF